MIMPPHSWTTWFISIVCLCIYVLRLLHVQSEVPLHSDEIYFLQRSASFEAFLHRDWTNILWYESEAYEQPRFSEYVFAGWLRSLGYPDINLTLRYARIHPPATPEEARIQHEVISELVGYSSMEGIPLTNRTMITPIMDARKASFIIQIAIGIVVLLLGSLIGNCWYSGVCTLLLANSTLFQTATTRVMADGLLILTLLLHVYLSLIYIRSSSEKFRLTWTLLAAGIVSGISISTKLNGFITIVFFTLLILIYGKNRFREFIPVILLYFFLTFSIFYVLNPTVWTAPVDGFRRMITFRLNYFTVQQEQFTAAAISGWQEKLSLVFHRILAPRATFGLIGSDYPLNVLLFLSGIVLFVRRRYRFPLLRVAVSMWCIFIIITTVIFLPLDWDRYYLPITIAVLLLQAETLSVLMELAVRVCRSAWVRHVPT